MSNGCIFFLIMILYVTVALSALVSSFGFLIYNGIYWGRIHGLFNLIPTKFGHLNHLWKLSLSSWVLGLIVPLLGPTIPAILIMIWTTPSQCISNEQQFIQAVKTQSSFGETWMNYMKSHTDPIPEWENSKWFKDWFYARCDKPFIYNAAFLACFVYPFIGLIIVRVITSITNKRNGYEKQN
ncbi:hypothetical protein TRFO_12813 [Tritrichomonas foetus]|uniref:Transmembrane protein n=1 Tax=Tritrichomonas foetus TaxID=1144522 RepID=A0A1J4L0K2_9EUKA|nr:hypothetical protein TRFO_12813 [Tritrichomonas foetus]|eukprot:OHT16930.1 hypothetical protein TRFO_12813 [Tritrichomonas foetus]